MEIEVRGVSFAYPTPSGEAVAALKGINLKTVPGEFLVLTGATGSGKSTLAELMAGLRAPSQGQVLLDGIDTARRGAAVKQRRREVAMAFQYPERQLFAETVEQDVAFGPQNRQLPERIIKDRVASSLKGVGLKPEEFVRRSPFGLSGGQQRRVALAGVIALKPAVLILDEPTAGLDGEGRRAILDLLQAYRREKGRTVVLISHHLADVAELADRVAVLHQGEMVFIGQMRELFALGEDLAAWGLLPPPAVSVLLQLQKRGADLATKALSVDEVAEAILAWLGRE